MYLLICEKRNARRINQKHLALLPVGAGEQNRGMGGPHLARCALGGSDLRVTVLFHNTIHNYN